MASIFFYLRDKSAKNKTVIMASIAWNKHRIRVSTFIAINPCQWDFKLRMPLSANMASDNELIRRKLTQLKLHYEKIIFDLEYFLERPPSPGELMAKLMPDKGSAGTNSEIISTLNRFISAEITKIVEELQAKGISLNKNNLSSSYLQTLRLLESFNHGQHLRFENIDQAFYSKFLNYCTQVKSYKPNNTGKHIRNIKALMNKAYKQGLHQNTSFRHFAKPVENVDTIYLNTDEISKIAELEFNADNMHLQTTRDLFVIACWTGLRFGDWSQFTQLNLRENMVTVIAQKTGKPVVIPLHPQVKTIAERYNFQLPQPKHNVVVNRDLKEIGKLAGINQLVEVAETRNGLKKAILHEKYKLISCHTARRSFATNLYNMGISAIDIMQITGHKTETVFMKYIRISRQEAAARILQKFNLH